MSRPVLVAVVTYRRPAELAALLPELVRQLRAAGAPGRVLVVDNDPDGGAAAVAAAHGDDVRYVHEATPGIAAARNRALAEAADDDLLVFVDDDEQPVPGWLADLLLARVRYGADAVVGPVVSEFEHEPTPWVRAGRFFDRRRLPSGSPVDVAATNNLLLDMRVVRRHGLAFDERFGLSGGSDTLFTRRLAAAGARMVWCDEALVVDRVPAGRLRPRWVLLRALRSGNSWSRTTLELAGSRRARILARAQLTRDGGVRLSGGLLRAAVGAVLRSASHQARGLRTGARGLGMLLGAYGYVYAEYRRRPAAAPAGRPSPAAASGGAP